MSEGKEKAIESSLVYCATNRLDRDLPGRLPHLNPCGASGDEAEDGNGERRAFENVCCIREAFYRSHIAPLFRNIDSSGAAILSHRGLLFLGLRNPDR